MTARQSAKRKDPIRPADFTRDQLSTQTRRPFVINKGQSVDAIYVSPDLVEWADNPLLVALPRALDKTQAADRLAREPKYDRNQIRSQPGYIRRLILQNAMKFVFIPLDRHLDLHQRFQCAIRVGYADRNPLDLTYEDKLEKRLDEFDQYALSDRRQIDGSATTASGFNIFGISGGGKSRAMLRCLHLLPQTICHSYFRNKNFTSKQLVWLKLDCPFDGNPKGLCIQFSNTVDAILGTQYRRDFGKNRITDSMMSDMALIAANHSLGILVVDEIQRLSLAKSGGAEKMLNFFVQLVSTIGVPVVLVGTYKGMAVLSGEFSQIRRGTGQGDMIWDRMENDAQWHFFIESLWRYQFVRKDSSPDDHGKTDDTLGDVLYDESQGIVDLAIKLFMFTQERAIETGQERISAGLIRKVAKDKLKIPRQVLHALRTKNMAVIERFEDLYPAAFRDYLTQQDKVPDIEGKLATSPEIKTLLDQFSNFEPDPMEEIEIPG